MTAPDDNDKNSIEPSAEPRDAARLTRRRWLTASAVLPLATAAAASTIRGELPWHEGSMAIPPSEAGANASASTSASTDTSYVFFTPAESAFVEAAIARLIPDDDLGPGALQAGAAYFIDRQLAGEYGQGGAGTCRARGPRANRPRATRRACRRPRCTAPRSARSMPRRRATRSRRSRNSRPPTRDAWLKRLEAGELPLPTADAKTFFTLLWQNTQEGFWSDPVYGGNRGMAGWKLIGFPGARYDHGPYVAKHGEIYPLPPVGLKGRVEWLSKR